MLAWSRSRAKPGRLPMTCLTVPPVAPAMRAAMAVGCPSRVVTMYELGTFSPGGAGTNFVESGRVGVTSAAGASVVASPPGVVGASEHPARKAAMKRAWTAVGLVPPGERRAIEQCILSPPLVDGLNPRGVCAATFRASSLTVEIRSLGDRLAYFGDGVAILDSKCLRPGLRARACREPREGRSVTKK